MTPPELITTLLLSHNVLVHWAFSFFEEDIILSSCPVTYVSRALAAAMQMSNAIAIAYSTASLMRQLVDRCIASS